jgi:soluble lytic murein transglycosylase-like protein
VKKGRNGEIGLMQVTPVVAREWAADNNSARFTAAQTDGRRRFITDPERNIQIACWYLEKAGDNYQGTPGREGACSRLTMPGRVRAAD